MGRYVFHQKHAGARNNIYLYTHIYSSTQPLSEPSEAFSFVNDVEESVDRCKRRTAHEQTPKLIDRRGLSGSAVLWHKTRDKRHPR